MAVRIMLLIKSLKGKKKRNVKTSALVNSGYEAEKSELLIPEGLRALQKCKENVNHAS